MKIQSRGTSRTDRVAPTAQYLRGYGAQTKPPAVVERSAEAAATINVLGIPEHELTPRVRDAIMKLMAEVETLRQSLHQTRSRLVDKEQEADQDPLLPVLNRRAFVRELTRQIGYSARYKVPSSLIYFDLDGFKHVNDAHGHAAGDTVLAHFGEVLLRHVRDSDIVGRLGGDEFGVILMHAGQDLAHTKARALADELAKKPPRWKGKALEVSFSYGAFELMSGEDAEGAMARADEAMYRNKDQRRKAATP